MLGKHIRENRLQKLARRIEELRRKDEQTAERRARVAGQRNEAVVNLWRLCHSFAERLNAHIQHDRVEVTPNEPPDEIPEDTPLQLLLNVRGRVLLLDIRAPVNLVSTENFKKPYILEGEVRFFNQELLENEQVAEHGVFFCHGEGVWYYWNGHTYKSGLIDEDYLAGLLEKIL